MQVNESSVKIHYTTDYSKFRMMLGNRQLNENKIKKIIADIEAGTDVLMYYPIQVIDKGNVYEIADGQHRFYICRKLKRPVHFIIMKKELALPDIAKINSNVEKWKSKDYINSYVQLGNENYVKLQEVIDAYGIPATITMKLLAYGTPGNAQSAVKDSYEFQRGGFVVNYWDETLEFLELMQNFKEFEAWKTLAFFIAVYRIREAGKVNMVKLVEKYKKNADELVKQEGFKGYITNLETIFNKGLKERFVIY